MLQEFVKLDRTILNHNYEILAISMILIPMSPYSQILRTSAEHSGKHLKESSGNLKKENHVSIFRLTIFFCFIQRVRPGRGRKGRRPRRRRPLQSSRTLRLRFQRRSASASSLSNTWFRICSLLFFNIRFRRKKEKKK